MFYVYLYLSHFRYLNPIQAGVFWNHIGWGAQCAPPLFLLCLWSNYNQTWHDGTLGQNLSKVIKILLTSSLGRKYDVIKPFLLLFQVKIRVPLSFELKFGTGVNSEALISNLRQKMRFFTKNLKILLNRSWTKELQMMPYIIILKVRKFHQSSRNRFGTAGKKPVGGGGGGGGTGSVP